MGGTTGKGHPGILTALGISGPTLRQACPLYPLLTFVPEPYPPHASLYFHICNIWEGPSTPNCTLSKVCAQQLATLQQDGSNAAL